MYLHTDKLKNTCTSVLKLHFVMNEAKFLYVY